MGEEQILRKSVVFTRAALASSTTALQPANGTGASSFGALENDKFQPAMET